MAHGVGWRGVFLAAAGSLAALLLANLIFLRESAGGTRPALAGSESAERVCGRRTERGEGLGLVAILRPLLASFPFWMVCLLSLGTTLLRETFNFWTPTYFVQYVGLTSSVAAARSALFPLFGGISVLAGGSAERQAGTEWPQRGAGGRHGGQHGVSAATGAHARATRANGRQWCW